MDNFDTFRWTRRAYDDIVRRIGNAIIGGDFSGNARGNYAIDIQITRGLATNVASGQKAVAYGNDSRASGTDSIAIGSSNIASGADGATAIGLSCSAQGNSSLAAGFEATTAAAASEALALGSGAGASATKSAALGPNATARITKTTNIAGAIIARKADGQTAANWVLAYAAAEIIILTEDIDLTAAPADYTITIPTSATFWPGEVGLICTSLAALATQPTIRAGNSGSPAKHLAATTTTLLTAALKRERYTPLVPEDGETTLSAGVTVAATATAMTGRFYWKGILVENQ